MKNQLSPPVDLEYSETPDRINYTTADVVIKDCLTDYGLHTHRTKITHVIDGLKPVNRRVLLINNTTTPRKVMAIVGSTMEKYHPSGDASIADAMIRMAQDFTNRINLMFCDSNPGSYSGARPSKPRYLDIGASKFAVDVYVQNINYDVFDYIPSELGYGVEPKFLIPKLPMALLVSNFGMGLAHKSDPAQLNLEEVCHLVVRYLKLFYNKQASNAEKYLKLAKYCVPDFPIRNLLRNKKYLVSQYEQGSFKVPIVADGLMEISPNSFTIITLPFGTKPNDVYQRAGLMLEENKENFINKHFQSVFNDTPLHEAKIVFYLKRGINPFDILDEFKQFVGFTAKWTPTYLFMTQNDKIEYLDPISILEYWLQERVRAIKAELRYGQRKYAEDIRRITAFIKIGDNIDDVIHILRHEVSTKEEAYPILEKKYGLSISQSMAIMKYRLENIPKKQHVELMDELASVKASMSELHSRFMNVDVHISQECESFIKKYPNLCDRRCVPPSHIGYIKAMGGIIQFGSESEMVELLTVFSKQDPELTIYPNSHKHSYLIGSMVVTEDTMSLPKEMVGSHIVTSKTILRYTIVIGNGTIFRVNKLGVDTQKGMEYIHTDDRAIVIHKNGLVEQIDVSSIPLRNSFKSKGSNSSILHISNCVSSDRVLIVHTRETNTVVFEWVEVGKKFIMPPQSVAKTTILGVYKHGDRIGLSVPKSCVNKCGTNLILVDDLSIFTEEKTEIKLTSKSHPTINMKKINSANLLKLA